MPENIRCCWRTSNFFSYKFPPLTGKKMRKWEAFSSSMKNKTSYVVVQFLGSGSRRRFITSLFFPLLKVLDMFSLPPPFPHRRKLKISRRPCPQKSRFLTQAPKKNGKKKFQIYFFISPMLQYFPTTSAIYHSRLTRKSVVGAGGSNCHRGQSSSTMYLVPDQHWRPQRYLWSVGETFRGKNCHSSLNYVWSLSRCFTCVQMGGERGQTFWLIPRQSWSGSSRLIYTVLC